MQGKVEGLCQVPFISKPTETYFVYLCHWHCLHFWGGMCNLASNVRSLLFALEFAHFFKCTAVSFLVGCILKWPGTNEVHASSWKTSSDPCRCVYMCVFIRCGCVNVFPCVYRCTLYKYLITIKSGGFLRLLSAEHRQKWLSCAAELKVDCQLQITRSSLGNELVYFSLFLPVECRSSVCSCIIGL